MNAEQYEIHRKKCEKEALDDLVKEPRHLLNDIHDESNRVDLTPEARMANANKRIASLSIILATMQGQSSEKIRLAMVEAGAVQEEYARSANKIATEGLGLQKELGTLTSEIRDLTEGLHTLATSQEKTNRNSQRRDHILALKMAKLNRQMWGIAWVALGVSIIALIVGAVACWLQWMAWQFPQNSVENSADSQTVKREEITNTLPQHLLERTPPASTHEHPSLAPAPVAPPADSIPKTDTPKPPPPPQVPAPSPQAEPKPNACLSSPNLLYSISSCTTSRFVSTQSSMPFVDDSREASSPVGGINTAAESVG